MVLVPMVGVAAPDEYLEFLTVQDSRCQILSTGGQLKLVKNTHPQRQIKVRLQRMFANVKQAGLLVAQIHAAGETLSLGCSRVDGKEQRWDLVRAEFQD